MYKQYAHRIGQGGEAMVTIRIITKDGKVYTDPKDVHIPRNEKYAMLYRIVDSHKPVGKKGENA